MHRVLIQREHSIFHVSDMFLLLCFFCHIQGSGSISASCALTSNCDTLQHTAPTRCNTLYNTATRYHLTETYWHLGASRLPVKRKKNTHTYIHTHTHPHTHTHIHTHTHTHTRTGISEHLGFLCHYVKNKGSVEVNTHTQKISITIIILYHCDQAYII